MLRKNHLIDATQGSIIGKIFLYTYPLMLSMLVQTLFNAAALSSAVLPFGNHRRHARQR